MHLLPPLPTAAQDTRPWLPPDQCLCHSALPLRLVSVDCATGETVPLGSQRGRGEREREMLVCSLHSYILLPHDLDVPASASSNLGHCFRKNQFAPAALGSCHPIPSLSPSVLSQVTHPPLLVTLTLLHLYE